MSPYRDDIRRLIAQVRSRWQRLRAFEAAFAAAVGVAAVVGAALAVAPWIARTAPALAALGVVAALLAFGIAAWRLFPLRHRPSDAKVARFVEERAPDLDDRLATAVHVLDSDDGGPSLATSMLADAARRCGKVDLDALVPRTDLRRAGIRAMAAIVVLLALLIVGRNRVHQAYDAAALTLFPARVTLDVKPGNARIRSGEPLAVTARLVGNRAPIAMKIEIGEGDRARASEMEEKEDGFEYAIDHAVSSFTYRVAAGELASPTYSVTVVQPPRVQRIDVDYEYPASLGLQPRSEEDGGDIYAPGGTKVRLHIHADRPIQSGQMTRVEGGAVELSAESATTLTGTFAVDRNDSYHVTLADADGFRSDQSPEYFIRALADRPPDVRITEPAGDRNVTSLEEIDVGARADDDYGIEHLDLVYSVHGEEHVQPMDVPRRATSVTGRATIYLEDLHVVPGDLVPYYVRARDVARGKASSEARSDIFFLQVRSFEQEFSLAQSRASAAGGNPELDDLVNSQKAVVVATWKLDDRAKTTGKNPEADIQTVGRAEEALRKRVQEAGSSFRESTMRDPRRPPDLGPTAPTDALRPEEAAMTAASLAMGQAVTALNGLSTSTALPHEMEALTELIKARADANQFQIALQTGGDSGRGNSNYDLSSLFDRELQRSQQTNYETPKTGQTQDAEASQLLEAVRQLAERQDELLKRQHELAGERLTPEEMARELEKLTRDQAELRRQAEELARQASGQQSGGQQPTRGQGQSQGGSQGQNGQRMRDVAEAMQAATNELRRNDAGQAGASGSRALAELRALEQRLSASQPDESRRALGDAQLEARQLADAERRVASELSDPATATDRDARRRLAGEQDRLADRSGRLQGQLSAQGTQKQAQGAGGQAADTARTAMADAARDLDRRQLSDQMKQAAEQLRGDRAGSGDRQTESNLRESARVLDSVADRLAAAASAGDEDSQKLGEQMMAMRGVRDRLDELSRQIQQAGQPGGSEAQLSRLRDEYANELERAERLLADMRRNNPSLDASVGFTFEGQGMVLSSPGTEAFKQDFSRWEDLRRQADTALQHAEASISGEIQARSSRDRLASGVDDTPPPAYQTQVDAYFKAIAETKR